MPILCVYHALQAVSHHRFLQVHTPLCVSQQMRLYVGKFFEFRLPFGCIINYNEEILSLTRKGKHDSNPDAVSVT